MAVYLSVAAVSAAFFAANEFGFWNVPVKEAYFLGMKEQLPPTEGEIHRLAAEKIEDTRSKSNMELIESLRVACENGLYAIEEAKNEVGLFAGVHAILDGVSQNLLVVKGLCWRSLNGANKD